MALNRRLIRGIIFDLDGTLTVPYLDFRKLKRQLHIGEQADILGHVATLSGDAKIKAMSIVDDFEEDGRNNMQLQPGINELFEFIADKTKLEVALLTRNNMQSVKTFLCKCNERGVKHITNETFSVILTRDFKPVKPDPAPVLHIASQWNIDAKNLMVVGDGKFDIMSGNRAGSTTFLLNNINNVDSKELADFNVNSLVELIPFIQSHFEDTTSVK
eukprot:gene9893-10906_t